MSKAKETPMMQQYFSIKENYQDAILFFRLGDFYEMFYDDAVEAAQVLEITLTSRNKKADDPIPMCGVPHHSATDYIRRLIQAGYKVAVCEQLEDPRQVKGMVKRDVTQVITPGTILVDDALNQKENNYLAALLKSSSAYFLAFVDISTGHSKITHTDDWTQFVSEIQTIKPSEWVYNPENLNGFNPEEIQELQERIQAHQSSFIEKGQEPLQRFALEEGTQAEKDLLNYLAAYLGSIQKQSLEHLQPVERYELNQFLQMNIYTKTQLELTESLRTKKRKGSLLWLIDKTQTAMGGRMLHQWLDKPLLRKQPLISRHQRVAQLMDHYFERVEIMSTLKRIYDLERLVTKISMQTVNAREVDQLRDSLLQVPIINANLDSINQVLNGIKTEEFQLFPEFRPLLEKIDQMLVEEPPISVTEGNIIKSGYDAELDKYRDALENGEQWLVELQQRERKITGLKTLKIGFNKVFGYFIEISRLQAESLEDERYIRKQTLTNNERYITEELKEIETTILQAQEKAELLEYQLFVELRDEINHYNSALQELARQIAELDVLCNFATLSENEGYVQADIVDEAKTFHLVESRHPVLEKLIGRDKFVANDFEVDPESFVQLLTGPNMSGKSTYMRQIAFAVILNQIGCFVPAKAARLPLVDQIFTRIGSSDDLTSGQSTFMVEMIETNYALQNATERSLLLFDEIGRGTATFDGIALAEAILYHICEKVRAATIFSTHYHELTDLDKELPVLKNIHVGAIEEFGKLVFLYKILEGAADKSYGIHVAQLAGLPQSLIHRSQLVLDELESNAKKLRHGHSQQLNLFYDSSAELVAEEKETDAKERGLTEVEKALIEEVQALDINQMTPIQALSQLAQLQEKVKGMGT